MSSRAAAKLPVFSFASAGLPGDEASEAWSGVMARMFRIERADPHDLPRGEMSSVVLGDVMANRSFFTPQRLTRDARRIDATPDHLVLQLYRSGGYGGEIGGRATRIARGQIAVCDLRRTLDVRAAASETIGLSVPRSLLHGVALGRLPCRFDAARERLLAARMTMLHLRLPTLTTADTAAETAGLVAVLRRLLDPSTSTDVLEGRELDDDLFLVAERAIAGALGSPDLSPALVASMLGVSRATLFRAFAPHGGVATHIWRMRLRAVRAALDQPIERRSLSQLGAEFGFASAAHLSRSFRAGYGVAPRDWRAERVAKASRDRRGDLNRLNTFWGALGR